MNTFMNALKNETNYTYTENSGLTHKTTNSALLDMFGMGGSMRNRSDEDVILMFKKAYEENPEYALKCLFYHRDARGGTGERRFFRVIINWLASYDTDAVVRNIKFIPEMGRWDDLYSLVDTPAENAAFNLMHEQLVLDMKCKGAVSLCAKWCKSINTSSPDSRKLGERTASALGLTAREYRKMLSYLRGKIRIVETLMSQNRWNEIEFDKIPSRAGLIYKNVFAHNEITAARYAEFMANKKTKVNAAVLNPVDIAQLIFSRNNPTTIERQIWDKYWSCLPDYYNGKEEPGIAIVDVSGSMYGTPMNAAISMGAYIAERGKGPFQNHFITFSDKPELVEFKGIDLYDKFVRASNANWSGSTNIEAVFDLLLNTAIKYNMFDKDMPKTLYIFSDMEFNSCVTSGPVEYKYDGLWRYNPYAHTCATENAINTVIEAQAAKWALHGYTIPRVIFWNLDARQNNIPAIGNGFSYVSGLSMNMIECILSGKDGEQLMFEKLNSDRYKDIH